MLISFPVTRHRCYLRSRLEMKTIIYYIFLFGVLIHPCRAFALRSIQSEGLSRSFAKIEQRYIVTSGDTKKLFLAENDLFNDDDENTSIRKKVVFTCPAFFSSNPFILKPFYRNLRKDFRNVNFSHVSLSEFISMRVLKL